MITKKEVQHVAKLARLNMTKKEEEKFTKELSLILDYIEKLKEINVDRIEPTSHPFEIENVMREDISKKPEMEVIQKLIKAAPARKQSYIKVKTILKSSKR